MHKSQADNPDWQGLKFDPATTKYGMFKGKELEGTFTDKDTLFIVGDVPQALIIKTMREHNLNYLYFDGIGPNFPVNFILVASIVSLFHKEISGLTVATPLFNSAVFDYLHFCDIAFYWVLTCVWHGKELEDTISQIKVLQTEMPSHKQAKILVKVDTGKDVFITPLHRLYLNSYNKGYSEDTLLVHELKG